METTEAVGEEMASQRERFARLARTDSRPVVVSAPQLFQTPEPLAAQLAGMFDRFGRTLEPSAGLGRLYRAVRAVSPDCPVTLVDCSPECCGELYHITEGDENARLVSGDFQTMDAERLGLFDSIIMNPPFRLGTDIRHVEHALTLLDRGGRLAAIVAAGERRRTAFGSRARAWIELPPGPFKSEGTDVNAAIVVIDR